MPIRRYQYARAEANRVEDRRVLREQSLDEPTQVVHFARRGGSATAGVAHYKAIETHGPTVRDGRSAEQHEHVLVPKRQVLRECVDPRDAAVLYDGRCLNPVLEAMCSHRHRVRIYGGETVERAEVLEVDSVRHGDPGIRRTRPAEMRLVDQLALLDARDTGQREPGRFSIEGPDESPCLGARIRGNSRSRRNLVAGRNVDTAARAVEAPVMVGAANLAVDHLPH